MTKIPPFRVQYTVWVDCESVETVDDETPDEARIAFAQEIREGFRQTAYDVPWEIETADIWEMPL